MPRSAKKSEGGRLVVQLVWELHVMVGSSAEKKNDVFFTRSNRALYLMRGLRSVPNLILWSPCQFPSVEKSSRNCNRSCCTFCGVDAFCPITMDGKRRLIPKLVGFRLFMKRLNCTVNWLRVRLESREVCIACQEMFSLVAFWNAFSAGGPPYSRFGSTRRPSVDVFR